MGWGMSLYQLLKYTDDKVVNLGEFDTLEPFCSILPKMCPGIDCLYLRGPLIKSVGKELDEIGTFLTTEEFINRYKDELSLAGFEDFTYAIQSGKRMLLMTGNYESPTMEEVNAIFRFCHTDIKYQGNLRPKYKVAPLMKLAK